MTTRYLHIRLSEAQAEALIVFIAATLNDTDNNDYWADESLNLRAVESKTRASLAVLRGER